jgi:hypothetical protein
LLSFYPCTVNKLKYYPSLVLRYVISPLHLVNLPKKENLRDDRKGIYRRVTLNLIA